MDISSETTRSANPANEIRLYKRRWLLMAVFLVYVVNLSLHWVEFSSITNIITRYYGVPAVWVEWTTVVFMLTYAIGVFPALYLLDKFGIRGSLIVVTLGILIGSVIKAFSMSPDRFYLLMVGQMFVALSSIFCFGFIGRFMATWFGNEEISQTGALILFGDQGGAALSFLIPSLLVEDSPDTKVIEQGMRRMHISFAIMATVSFVLVLLLFQEKPKIPPSFAQVKQLEEQVNVWKSMVKIFTQKSFILMAMSYSLANATHSVVSTLLNQLIEWNFEDKAQDAGKIGFVTMFSGMISSLILGYILDKKRHFKGNAVILSFGGTISIICFTITLKLGNIALVYVTAGMLGVCLLGYYATGIQMGIELTYPVPEGIVISSMALTTQILNICMVSWHGFILRKYGDLVSNSGLILYMMMSFIFACLIPANLKREQTEKSATASERQEFIFKEVNT